MCSSTVFIYFVYDFFIILGAHSLENTYLILKQSHFEQINLKRIYEEFRKNEADFNNLSLKGVFLKQGRSLFCGDKLIKEPFSLIIDQELYFLQLYLQLRIH